MSKIEALKWMPIDIDSWIFGSTRLELKIDERATWTDLLLLSGKDEGFIRANETTPYQMKQLAGLLCIEEELLTRTIRRCIETGKLIETKEKTLYAVNYKNYKLSSRHIRRIDNVLNERTPIRKASK